MITGKKYVFLNISMSLLTKFASGDNLTWTADTDCREFPSGDNLNP